MSKQSEMTKFYARVEKTDSCWIWKGGRVASGYGRFHINGKNHTAHRWLYMQLFGELPKDIYVCHKNMPQ